jgi:hypothetical protein
MGAQKKKFRFHPILVSASEAIRMTSSLACPPIRRALEGKECATGNNDVVAGTQPGCQIA